MDCIRGCERWLLGNQHTWQSTSDVTPHVAKLKLTVERCDARYDMQDACNLSFATTSE
jgi:hypothetical protein